MGVTVSKLKPRPEALEGPDWDTNAFGLCRFSSDNPLTLHPLPTGRGDSTTGHITVGAGLAPLVGLMRRWP
jgi:hypothetical protein